MPQKQDKRTEALILRRRAFDKDQLTVQKGVSRASLQLKNNLCRIFAFLELKKESIVSTYIPIRSEIDTTPITEWLRDFGHRICLPAIEKEHFRLKFLEWNSEDVLVPEKYGIPVPVNNRPMEPDVLLCPLVSFDEGGNRLGYGGGYYDRTIKELRKEKKIFAFGLGFSEQLSPYSLPTDDCDEKLDAVITDKNYFIF